MKKNTFIRSFFSFIFGITTLLVLTSCLNLNKTPETTETPDDPVVTPTPGPVETKYDEIVYKDILSKEDTYYVFVYSSKVTKDLVLLTKTNKTIKIQDQTYPFYVLDVKKTSNVDIMTTSPVDLTTVETYEQLKVTTTPSLLKIVDGKPVELYDVYDDIVDLVDKGDVTFVKEEVAEENYDDKFKELTSITSKTSESKVYKITSNETSVYLNSKGTKILTFISDEPVLNEIDESELEILEFDMIYSLLENYFTINYVSMDSNIKKEIISIENVSKNNWIIVYSLNSSSEFDEDLEITPLNFDSETTPTEPEEEIFEPYILTLKINLNTFNFTLSDDDTSVSLTIANELTVDSFETYFYKEEIPFEHREWETLSPHKINSFDIILERGDEPYMLYFYTEDIEVDSNLIKGQIFNFYDTNNKTELYLFNVDTLTEEQKAENNIYPNLLYFVQNSEIVDYFDNEEIIIEKLKLSNYTFKVNFKLDGQSLFVSYNFFENTELDIFKLISENIESEREILKVTIESELGNFIISENETMNISGDITISVEQKPIPVIVKVSLYVYIDGSYKFSYKVVSGESFNFADIFKTKTGKVLSDFESFGYYDTSTGQTISFNAGNAVFTKDVYIYVTSPVIPEPEPTPTPTPNPEPEPSPEPTPTPKPEPTPNPGTGPEIVKPDEPVVPTPEPEPTPEPKPGESYTVNKFESVSIDDFYIQYLSTRFKNVSEHVKDAEGSINSKFKYQLITNEFTLQFSVITLGGDYYSTINKTDKKLYDFNMSGNGNENLKIIDFSLHINKTGETITEYYSSSVTAKHYLDMTGTTYTEFMDVGLIPVPIGRTSGLYTAFLDTDYSIIIRGLNFDISLNVSIETESKKFTAAANKDFFAGFPYKPSSSVIKSKVDMRFYNNENDYYIANLSSTITSRQNFVDHNYCLDDWDNEKIDIEVTQKPKE